MANNELSLLSRHIDALHGAISDLVELQRETVEAQRREWDAASPQHAALGPILDRVDALQERLRAQRLEVERAAPSQPEQSRLDRIVAERIDVVERDGTLRMVLCNSAHMPDPVMDGKTLGSREGGDGAGIIFYNAEGDECGGLVFGGKSRDGQYDAGAALLFDQFKQDQTIGITYEDAGARRSAGFTVWDRPDTALSEQVERHHAIERMPDGPEKDQAIERFGAGGAMRVYVGRSPDGSAVVDLRDPAGNACLRLSVAAEGIPTLQFLDENGAVTLGLPDTAPNGTAKTNRSTQDQPER